MLPAHFAGVSGIVPMRARACNAPPVRQPEIPRQLPPGISHTNESSFNLFTLLVAAHRASPPVPSKADYFCRLFCCFTLQLCAGVLERCKRIRRSPVCQPSYLRSKGTPILLPDRLFRVVCPCSAWSNRAVIPPAPDVFAPSIRSSAPFHKSRLRRPCPPVPIHQREPHPRP